MAKLFREIVYNSTAVRRELRAFAKLLASRASRTRAG